MTNTLQQIKDGVASDFGQRDWRTADLNDSISEVMIDQIAIRYAQEQNKGLITALENIETFLDVGVSISTESIRRVIDKHKGGKS